MPGKGTSAASPTTYTAMNYARSSISADSTTWRVQVKCTLLAHRMSRFLGCDCTAGCRCRVIPGGLATSPKTSSDHLSKHHPPAPGCLKHTLWSECSLQNFLGENRHRFYFVVQQAEAGGPANDKMKVQPAFTMELSANELSSRLNAIDGKRCYGGLVRTSGSGFTVARDNSVAEISAGSTINAGAFKRIVDAHRCAPHTTWTDRCLPIACWRCVTWTMILKSATKTTPSDSENSIAYVPFVRLAFSRSIYEASCFHLETQHSLRFR